MDLDAAVLGVLQGVFEWLPVSSKTILMLYSILVSGRPLLQSYTLALALQSGTVLSATLYLRREVLNILLGRDRRLLMFIAISTLCTALSGVPLYTLFTELFKVESIGLGPLTMAIGLLLALQASIAVRVKPGAKGAGDISVADSIVFGLMQGLAATPGVSRSGITIATALYMGYRVEDSLKLSFLASIPANLGALAVTLLRGHVVVEVGSSELVALAISAIIGFIAMRYLIQTAVRYRHKLVLILGIVTVVIGLAVMGIEH